VDLVVLAVGRLGDQRADEDDPALAGEAAVVNFAWPVAALAAVRARLVAQGRGRIVVLSTLSAVRVRRSLYLYAGAKAGLDRVCVGLAESLEGTGAALTIVRPAFVATKMTAGLTPTPLSSTPDQVADAIVKGLAVGAKVVWCPPPLRYVAAVLRALPEPLWRIVAARA
ncbi:MAG: SDR family NAD(P)-dependent oxidoreductase, partial [Acidimicrobiales bacterium]